MTQPSTLSESNTSGYYYGSADPAHTHAYLWPAVKRLLKEHQPPCRIFELGCGSGATAGLLRGLGYSVTAVDPSADGIRIAGESYPGVTFETGSAYDDLA